MTAMSELQRALLEEGYKLEHIKIDAPMFVDGKEIQTIQGVEVKSIIYEDDATHWKRSTPKPETREEKS